MRLGFLFRYDRYQTAMQLAFYHFIFDFNFVNLLILFNLTKEPKKSNDIMCSSSIECDASQGLSCQGPDGAKTCQYLKKKRILFGYFVALTFFVIFKMPVNSIF